MAEEGEALGTEVAAVLPEALRRVVKARQKREQQATKAIEKAKVATAEAAAKIAAIGHAAVVPSLPEPEKLCQAVRQDLLGILREPEVLTGIREALHKPGKNVGLLKAILEFVGETSEREPQTQVTFINAIPRPPAPPTVDVTP